VAIAPAAPGECIHVRCAILGCARWVRGPDLGFADSLRSAHGRTAMNGTEIIGLVLAVGLLVYLTLALLKPEWFA